MNISHQNIYHRFVDLMDKDYLFFSHEFDGTLTYVTHQIYEILEMKAEEVIGQKWQEIFNIPNESIEKASEAVFECTKGIVPAPYEMKFITSTNKTVYLEIQEHPFFNENGDVAGVDGLAKDITIKKKEADERENLISNLQKSLEEITALRGIIPICSYCKKIRNEEGAWDQLEKYICNHSGAKFSHGICPACELKVRKEI